LFFSFQTMPDVFFDFPARVENRRAVRAAQKTQIRQIFKRSSDAR
jgi:hypothetical protein